MPHLATLMAGPLITTGRKGIAGFTRGIVITSPRSRSLPSVQRQLYGIPLNLFRNLTSTTDSPVLCMCKASQQLLLHLSARMSLRRASRSLVTACNYGPPICMRSRSKRFTRLGVDSPGKGLKSLYSSMRLEDRSGYKRPNNSQN
jgi:hypothetical protein